MRIQLVMREGGVGRGAWGQIEGRGGGRGAAGHRRPASNSHLKNDRE